MQGMELAEAVDESVGPVGVVTADDRPTPPPRPVLTLGELAALAVVVAIAAVGVVSWWLAQLGGHDGLISVAVALAVTLALGVTAVRVGGPVEVRFERTELALVAATAAAAAFFFFPGFPYAFADKDPGNYVIHGLSIAATGDSVQEDHLAERGLPASRFPGVAPDASGIAGRWTSQFYSLTSALFATADDLAGRGGLFNTPPLLATLSACVFAIGVRRATDTTTAAVAVALLVTCMMQVWQARYPSSEIPAQLFLMGALLAVGLVIETRWAGAALAAGLLVGVEFLTRPDGFLYLLLAGAAFALGSLTGRVDRRLALAAGLGLGLGLPLAWWNAYDIRRPYSDGNHVPTPFVLATACLVLLGLGLGGRALLATGRQRWPHHLARITRMGQRARTPAAVALWIVAGAFLLMVWFREDLFGIELRMTPFHEEPIRSLNELNLRWLAEYLTVPGLVVMWCGLLVVVLARARPALPAYLVPGLAVFPLYLWDARVSMRMMWWVRRFVPGVLPAVVVLMALALVWLIRRRPWPLRLAGGVGTGALVLAYAAMSLPLRHHREMDGSWDTAADIAAVAGEEQGVFLFTEAGDVFVDPMRNSPAVVWWVFDEVVANLPRHYDLGTVEEYQAAFPDHPVFLVTHDEPLPERLPRERFEPADKVMGELTMWEESSTNRPTGSRVARTVLVLWQLVPAGVQGGEVDSDLVTTDGPIRSAQGRVSRR